MTQRRSSRLLELKNQRESRKQSKVVGRHKEDASTGGRMESVGGGRRDRVASARDSTEIHDHSPAGPPK